MIIFQIVIALGVFGFFIGTPVAIFLAIKASGETDPILKRKINKKAIWSIVGPIILLFISLTLWGILGATKVIKP